MTRVLNVVYEERVGGPQLRVLQVARGLQKRGIETIVVIPRGEPGFNSLLQQAQIKFCELDLVRLRYTRNPGVHLRFLARYWSNVSALRRLIRDQNANIVHTNGLLHTQAAIAARLEGVGLIWHLNDCDTWRAFRLAFLPLVETLADRVAIAARAVGEYYFPDPTKVDGRLHLLYAPVDTGKYSPQVDGSAVRAELGIPARCPVIGTVANFGPGKGFEHILEAAPRLKQRFPDIRFLFVGEMLKNRKSYWSYIMRRTGELGLSENVLFAGRRQDIPQVMRALTIYVQASETEACPMAVLEASASGLPVVATKVGGTPEVVDDEKTGLLVPSKCPSAIADAVTHLLDHPELAQKMGMAGVERMHKVFSLDACVTEHIRAYTAALGHDNRAAKAGRLGWLRGGHRN
jgi:glycosyltransferase involved in cell wall biosynthesis